MFSLIYRSKVRESLDHDAIQALMQKSSRFNAQNKITGCLVYHDKNFIQLLEGNEKKVRNLFGKISKDSRHKDIVLLNLEENNFPLFSKFSMIHNNFKDLTDQVRHKRMLFHEIFHAADIVRSPGSSKLTLWAQVNSLLNIEDKHAYSNM
ncbi:BLUF domain-containing protein [Maribacter sp. PR1]|uniref:BLUF domain-containing protein n=1 Tax=Maribacter cobaltidurans TaxID=1178778 RepID=A0ABU7IUD7_9FLAO|nr:MULTISPECIES: BLUF domain-containing protein [Maribacter]MDC6389018.1 BLUF domain-containing protein [Maribacter sp. PR1]MEE1976406.1 BLUF domain-containing protein [Maribacter cobaltidurans]